MQESNHSSARVVSIKKIVTVLNGSRTNVHRHAKHKMLDNYATLFIIIENSELKTEYRTWHHTKYNSEQLHLDVY